MALANSKDLFSPEQLQSASDDLDSLAGDTEKEFLGIGTTLSSLADLCRTMTDDATKLSSRASFGEHDDPADQTAVNRDVFTEIGSHSGKSVSALKDGDILLTELLEMVAKLLGPLQKLYKIGRTFRVLGISIKIESSRSQGESSGFKLLAEEVADIATSVEDNCHHCLTKAGDVEKCIENTRRVLQNACAESTGAGEQAIFSLLRALDEIHGKAEMVATGIEKRSTAMAGGVGHVVMAMQFHDITRQQLENVVGALREVEDKAMGFDPGNEGERENTALEIYTLLSVQAAHLNSIYEQVVLAKHQIENGLLQIMEQADLQVRDARTLVEMEEKSGTSSVLVNLERETNSLVTALNDTLHIITQSSEESRNVHVIVSEIGEFITKIEEVAFDVKVLAINAMVEAIKCDTAGNALVVLAKELSNLSQETRDGAAYSIELLQEIVTGTEKQLQYSETLEQNGAAVDEMIKRAHRFTGSILTALEEVGTIAQKMSSASENLSCRITELIPAITFPRTMGDRITANWEIICETIDRIDQAYPQFLQNNAEVKQMLANLNKQYVMERERSIHAQVVGLGGSPETNEIELFGPETDETAGPQASEPSKREKEDDDFGDNVELF